MARIDCLAFDVVAGGQQERLHDPLFELGLKYSLGLGVKLDLVEAHRWFNISSVRGNTAARVYRAEIAVELSKAEIARAQRLAREWMLAN